VVGGRSARAARPARRRPQHHRQLRRRVRGVLPV